ncbi:MAG: hypothetical protein MI757_22885, partial [Pirellulales bacterium]|nr:hypothetical protein [Pirellulales bacterium]
MSLNDLAQAFVLRMALSFIMHRGRMSCSQAAGCGYRIPWQIPHYTKEYWGQKGLKHRTTAEVAAAVVVLGDTAYEAKVVQKACEDRQYIWIAPANPERVYEGPTG